MDKQITMLVFSLRHGGAEKVCLTLCNEFAKRNYKTELWIADNTESSLTKKLDKSVTVYPMDKKHVRNTIIPLIKLLLKRKPERLLVFHIELAILAIVFKKILFLKTFVVVRSINTLSHAFIYPRNLWEKYFARKVIKRILLFSDKIIAQSSGMKKDLVKTFRIPDSKIITIHNPANLFSPDNIEKTESPANEFLYVGRLNPQKGLVNLIEAFRLAYQQNKNIHLTMVGEGPEKDKLVALAEKYDLSGQITFEGFRSQTDIYYARARATLLTSDFEGFPNVLVESLSIGTPVISFNCPSGPEDIIEQGINGILIPHHNVEKFSKAILAVANGEVKFNIQNVMNSSKKFSIDRIVEKYEEVMFNQ